MVCRPMRENITTIYASGPDENSYTALYQNPSSKGSVSDSSAAAFDVGKWYDPPLCSYGF